MEGEELLGEEIFFEALFVGEHHNPRPDSFPIVLSDRLWGHPKSRIDVDARAQRGGSRSDWLYPRAVSRCAYLPAGLMQNLVLLKSCAVEVCVVI